MAAGVYPRPRRKRSILALSEAPVKVLISNRRRSKKALREAASSAAVQTAPETLSPRPPSLARM